MLMVRRNLAKYTKTLLYKDVPANNHPAFTPIGLFNLPTTDYGQLTVPGTWVSNHRSNFIILDLELPMQSRDVSEFMSSF